MAIINSITYGVGGGLSPTIRTYAPLGSSVTCNGEIKTVTDTSVDFEVAVSATPYTVTASLNGKTQSKSVTVDAVALFPVEIDYKLWLYDEGDECEDVTGGWSNDGYYNSAITMSAPTKNIDNITFQNSSSVARGVGNQTPINRKGYNKVCVLLTSNNGEVRILSSGKNFDSNRIAGDEFSCTNEVKEFNISSYSGETINIAIYAYAWSTTRSATVYKIWLE